MPERTVQIHLVQARSHNQRNDAKTVDQAGSAKRRGSIANTEVSRGGSETVQDSSENMGVSNTDGAANGRATHWPLTFKVLSRQDRRSSVGEDFCDARNGLTELTSVCYPLNMHTKLSFTFRLFNVWLQDWLAAPLKLSQA